MRNWRQFLRQRQNLAGLFIIAFFAVLAIAAPRLAPPDDLENPSPFKITGQAFSRLPSPPTAENKLGTVPQISELPQFGFVPGQDASYHWDVYYTLIWGARSAFRFGLTVTLTAAVFGVVVGAVSAYLDGIANRFLMMMTDAFLAFPVIAAVWVIQRALFGRLYDPFLDLTTLNWWETILYTSKANPIMLALILFSWMPYARLVNTTISQSKHTEYVAAARALGASEGRILFRHLLPNSISPAIILIARDIGGMVVLASAFTFIGFGGDIAWAIVLVSSRDFVIGLGGNPFVYWWSFVPVALALTLFAGGWNLLGDGLNAALDPRRTKA